MGGMLLKMASVGEGKERVLTLELLRLWTGLEATQPSGLLTTGVSSCICGKENDVTTLSRGLCSGEFTHKSRD